MSTTTESTCSTYVWRSTLDGGRHMNICYYTSLHFHSNLITPNFAFLPSCFLLSCLFAIFTRQHKFNPAKSATWHLYYSNDTYRMSIKKFDTALLSIGYYSYKPHQSLKVPPFQHEMKFLSEGFKFKCGEWCDLTSYSTIIITLNKIIRSTKFM